MSFLKGFALLVQFDGERVEGSFGRPTGQRVEQVAFSQRANTDGKLQDRLYLLERVPQFTGQAGKLQRAFDHVEQILRLIEVCRKSFDRAVSLQHLFAQPTQRMVSEAGVFAQIGQSDSEPGDYVPVLQPQWIFGKYIFDLRWHGARVCDPQRIVLSGLL